VIEWNTQGIQGASGVFLSGRRCKEQTFQAREEKVERKIGNLVVEVEWVFKKG